MAMESLSTMDELDSELTLEEINQALDQPFSGKALGMMAYLLKSLSVQKEHFSRHYMRYFANAGEKVRIHRTFYKNKGDRGDCNNYRGISLLNIISKIFAKDVLMKLRVLAERIYPESQCGFRAKRATINMIFSLQQLQEMQRAGKATLCCLH